MSEFHRSGPSASRLTRFVVLAVIVIALVSIRKFWTTRTQDDIVTTSGAVEQNSDTFEATVVAVPDGDSLVVAIEGKQQRVRIQGVDCPERKQPFGDQAWRFTEQLVLGKTVTIHRKGIDQYDRILADIILSNGSRLDETLVQSGWAWQYQKYNDDTLLQQLEYEARKAKRGLWVEDDPVPPWQWRNQHSDR